MDKNGSKITISLYIVDNLLTSQLKVAEYGSSIGI